MNKEINILDELTSNEYLLPDVQVVKDHTTFHITMELTIHREVAEELFEKMTRVIKIFFEFDYLEKDKTKHFYKRLYRLFIGENDWHTFISAIRLIDQIIETPIVNEPMNGNSVTFDTNPKHDYVWTYISNQLSSAIYFEDIARAKFFADMIHSFYPNVTEDEILTYLYHIAKRRYWDTDRILSSFIKPYAYSSFNLEQYEITHRLIKQKLSIDNIKFIIINNKEEFSLEEALNCNFEIHAKSMYIRKSKTDEKIPSELSNKVAKYVEQHYQELPIDFIIQSNLPNRLNKPYWYFIYGIVTDDENNKAFVVINSNVPYTKETMETWLK